MYEGIISSNSITVSKNNSENEMKENRNEMNNIVEDRKEVTAEHCNEHVTENERKCSITKKNSRKVINRTRNRTFMHGIPKEANLNQIDWNSQTCKEFLFCFLYF